MRNELKIPYEKFLSRVDDFSQKIISEKVSKLSDFDTSEETLDALYKAISIRLRQRIKAHIKAKKLVAVPARCRIESDGRYRRRELDIEDRDIPKRYLDVENLIPNLRERIINEIQLQRLKNVDTTIEE